MERVEFLGESTKKSKEGYTMKKAFETTLAGYTGDKMDANDRKEGAHNAD